MADPSKEESPDKTIHSLDSSIEDFKRAKEAKERLEASKKTDT